MKVLFAVLALLVASKFFVQQQIYREATSEALISAYSAHAIEACQSDAGVTGTGAISELWGKPASIKLEIGRSELGVAMWDLDNKQWAAAYRQPYLVLAPSDAAAGLSCIYDIMAGAASISGRHG